ncbi:RNA-binding protein Vip1 [Schizosaccharomyces cryophilus OY26]|uniref:RNA-binding protein Vip1 n=1 Tax=Schizosaccharomyces cryophilus (strain OY26 / ATCC MYA-4695 / CBS 11777 / NBRC 106824 / NRRL Y48691) TaxID=653667 RepID=S9X179_SCHCR|nr:RNA-binding protein Vip1 [Schizosaccharomyces cryophilus OY26]EPY50862.1 RNA-binding protein Vip1 [Schizosaccharomyces cryophilus OY26]
MSNQVIVKNISLDVTEKQISDFFSFCGKVSSISTAKEGDTQTANIQFERPSATKTALLLQDALLGQNKIQISSSDAPAAAGNVFDKGGAGGDQATSQEDKPRSAIISELLSRGYHLSDVTLEKGIQLDQSLGVSSRFKGVLESALSSVRSMNERYHVSEKANEVDNKLSISDTFNRTTSLVGNYFNKAYETAAGTSAGQKVSSAYGSGKSQLFGIHSQARKLADSKSHAQNATTGHTEATPAAPTDPSVDTKPSE